MRKYQPIWEELKKHGKAMLSAPSHSHARIIKAVTKEKWMDAGFRLLAAEKNKTFVLSHEVTNKEQVVTFYLKELEEHSINLSDL